jgi:hypothetical protein
VLLGDKSDQKRQKVTKFGQKVTKIVSTVWITRKKTDRKLLYKPLGTRHHAGYGCKVLRITGCIYSGYVRGYE